MLFLSVLSANDIGLDEYQDRSLYSLDVHIILLDLYIGDLFLNFMRIIAH